MTLDARQLRNALGCFTTGVCIVTATGRDCGPIGLTINSFASVSLDPPLILWSLDRASDTFPVFAGATHFCINVLSDEAVGLSTRLSVKANHGLMDEIGSTGTGDVPILRGVLAHFECEVTARHNGGDHIIIVGRVVRFAYDERAQPLVYYRGRYRGLAPLDD
jgi:flavin reductase (DIM6/NTAB) family NADH-FMN oxidoreductase RutF